MKHLKLFQADAEYQSFVSNVKTPNVSFVETDNLVYYHPQTNEMSEYKMVDLGLPSGLKWADRNIGAVSPEDAGLYFQWGDTVGYTPEQIANGEKVFANDWSGYFDTTDGGSTFNKYTIDKLTTLQPEDDAATVNIGSTWRMPSSAEIQELIDNTTITVIDVLGNEFTYIYGEFPTQNELKLAKFTGSNGKYICIPFSGLCSESSVYYNETGFLWSSSLDEESSNQYAKNLYMLSGSITLNGDYGGRYYGRPVRGVHK